MILGDLLAPAPGFQRSVNVQYDLDNPDRVTSYISTSMAEWVIGDVLDALHNHGSHAAMLIGSYGTGKSHLVTLLGGIIRKRIESKCYENIVKQFRDDRAARTLSRELSIDRPYLVVPVTGGSDKLDALILRGLRRALDRDGLDVPMVSAYSTALDSISQWKSEYPSTYGSLCKMVSETAYKTMDGFMEALRAYDEGALDRFEDMYRSLTSGVQFDRMGSNLTSVLESTSRDLVDRGYRGIFLIIDEFNKTLEHFSGDVATLKALQDLAELCNRSDDSLSLYTLLISHKTIGQYVQGEIRHNAEDWLKIEGRFRLFDLTRRPSERYELLSHVLVKKQANWYHLIESAAGPLLKVERPELRMLLEAANPGVSWDQIEITIRDCYPLHPLLVYVLPIVSARLAQNERTMYTFVASPDDSPVTRVLEREISELHYVYLADAFDYFSVEMRRAIEPELRSLWIRVTNALEQCVDRPIEALILKTIGVCSILGNPILRMKEMIQYAVSPRVTTSEFNEAISSLVARKVVFLGGTGILEVCASVDMDVPGEIARRVERMTLEPVFDLQRYGIADYLLPHRYNHQYKITRFMRPMYVDLRGMTTVTKDPQNAAPPGTDGVVMYVFPSTKEELAECKAQAARFHDRRFLIAIPLEPVSMREVILRLRAIDDVRLTLAKTANDEATRSLLDLYRNDSVTLLRNKLNQVVMASRSVEYYWKGKSVTGIVSQSALSNLASNVMNDVLPLTPTINNELVNKAQPTLMSRRALGTVIDALLESGLTQINLPSAQERFMFETLFLETGLIQGDGSLSHASRAVLAYIDQFVESSRANPQPLKDLIQALMMPPYGLRRGTLPVFLTVSFVKHQKTVTLREGGVERPLDAGLIDAIVSDPVRFTIQAEQWTDSHDELVRGLARVFGYHIESSLSPRALSLAGEAAFRWLLSLPKYARETNKVSESAKALRRLARAAASNPRRVFLHDMPESVRAQAGNSTDVSFVIEHIREAQVELEGTLNRLHQSIMTMLRTALRDLGIVDSSLVTMMKEAVRPDLTSSTAWKRVAAFAVDFSGSDADFVSGLAKAMTGLKMEDWSDETEASFRTEIESLNSIRLQTAVTGTQRYYELVVPVGDESARKYQIPEVALSDMASVLQSSLESTIRRFGTAVSSLEIRQVLVNLTQRMLQE